MNKKLTAIFASSIICLTILASTPLANATLVFSEDFSNGDFTIWSSSKIGYDSSQTVSNGIARFIVPAPLGGNYTYSYVLKDGFTSTPNSTITAQQDIYVTKVPNGYTQGNGAIFFFYLCDSTDPSGGNGNFGVGIDGSGVWSLWLGGAALYTYVFQTAGAPPVSSTWYHIALIVDNHLGTVILTVNGSVVINVAQQQFTDKTHPITLWSGMGEDWSSQDSGYHEVDIDNVILEISDAPTSNLDVTTPTQTPTTNIAEFPYAAIIILFVMVALLTAFFFKKASKKGKPALVLQNLGVSC